MDLATLLKLGPCGAAGLLLGLLVIWWVEPTTGAGAVLFVLIGVAFALVVCGIASLFRRKSPSDAGKSGKA